MRGLFRTFVFSNSPWYYADINKQEDCIWNLYISKPGITSFLTYDCDRRIGQSDDGDGGFGII